MIFHRLSREDITTDRRRSRSSCSPTAVRERGIEIELTDDARTLLGNLGYDPTYGARPLKRVIQRQLVDRLALKLLEGEFAEGDTVRVDAAGGELVFERVETSAPRRRADRPQRHNTRRDGGLPRSNRLARAIASSTQAMSSARAGGCAPDFQWNEAAEIPGRRTARTGTSSSATCAASSCSGRSSASTRRWIEAPSDDLVYASVRARGRGKASDEAVEFVIHHVWRLRDGLYSRMDAYLDEDEARDAAGV